MATRLRSWLAAFFRGFGSVLDLCPAYEGPYADSLRVYGSSTMTGPEKDAEMLRRDAEAIRGDWARVWRDIHEAQRKQPC